MNYPSNVQFAAESTLAYLERWGWRKFGGGYGPHGEACVYLGAISAVGHDDADELLNALRKDLGLGMAAIFDWNDSPDTSFEDLREVLTRIATPAREPEPIAV